MTDTEAPSPADEAPEKQAAETPAEEPAEEPAPEPADDRDWWERRYTFTGTAVGLVFL